MVCFESTCIWLALFACGLYSSNVTPSPILPESTPAAVCDFNGTFYKIGERFKPDVCTDCVCKVSGFYRCIVSNCHVPPPCVDSVQDPTQCCRVCPNGSNCRHTDGTMIKLGETYYPDRFTSCGCPLMPEFTLKENLPICDNVGDLLIG